jgi:hypothetical protein
MVFSLYFSSTNDSVDAEAHSEHVKVIRCDIKQLGSVERSIHHYIEFT